MTQLLAVPAGGYESGGLAKFRRPTVARVFLELSSALFKLVHLSPSPCQVPGYPGQPRASPAVCPAQPGPTGCPYSPVPRPAGLPAWCQGHTDLFLQAANGRVLY